MCCENAKEMSKKQQAFFTENMGFPGVLVIIIKKSSSSREGDYFYFLSFAAPSRPLEQTRNEDTAASNDETKAAFIEVKLNWYLHPNTTFLMCSSSAVFHRKYDLEKGSDHQLPRGDATRPVILRMGKLISIFLLALGTKKNILLQKSRHIRMKEKSFFLHFFCERLVFCKLIKQLGKCQCDLVQCSEH